MVKIRTVLLLLLPLGVVRWCLRDVCYTPIHLSNGRIVRGIRIDNKQWFMIDSKWEEQQL